MTTLHTFLTDEQITAALVLWRRPHMSRMFHCDVKRQIIEPNMAEINRKLGQENDPAFLAYAVEYVFMQIARS